ncbi:conserved hypothetical protein [[Clostridium] ultunense Esp]|nr:conserved hypothetical protein [[Clostridium] ultunense Esp]
MKKVLVVCGNGLGSSFMMEIMVKNVLAEMGISAEIAHTDLTTGKSEKADIYIGAADIVANLEDGKRTVIGLKNILDKSELKTKLQKYF